jgi:predicted nucleic acid-binding protein
VLVTYTALYDANVLYPAPLRDLLMRLAVEDIFLARWTERIHDEWTRSVLKNRADLTPEQLKRTCELMNRSVRDCLITDYEHLIDALSLPDPDDRHVLAAAIKGRADVIVTTNLKDFPPRALEPHGVEAVHPDDFVALQFDLNKEAVCRAVSKQRASLRNPPKSAEQLLETFVKLRMPNTVNRLRGVKELL